MIQQPVILLAEDLEDDILLIQRAFRSAGIHNPFQVVRDGEQAIDYLKGQGAYANRSEFPLPSLFLLDLKMPKVDGFEVLLWMQTQPHLAGLTVIVLTSSDQLRDVNRAYQLGAKSFLVKPLEFQHYKDLSILLDKYWLKTVVLPAISRPSVAATGNKPDGSA